jgi:hypothetical protein
VRRLPPRKLQPRTPAAKFFYEKSEQALRQARLIFALARFERTYSEK